MPWDAFGATAKEVLRKCRKRKNDSRPDGRYKKTAIRPGAVWLDIRLIFYLHLSAYLDLPPELSWPRTF